MTDQRLEINGKLVGFITTATPRKRTGPGMGYLDAHADAQRRLRRGEKQRKCTNCGLWRWDDQACEVDSCRGKPRLTAAEERAMHRQVKKRLAAVRGEG